MFTSVDAVDAAADDDEVDDDDILWRLIKVLLSFMMMYVELIWRTCLLKQSADQDLNTRVCVYYSR